MVNENSGFWRMGKRRLHRKEVYGNAFLPFEKETFSKLPLNIPYAKMLRNNRLKLFKQAQSEKWTLAKYKQAVMWEYESRGINTQAPGSAEAFALLRIFEAEWKKVADPDDPYLLMMHKKKNHGDTVDRNKLRKAKQIYNSRPEVKLARAKYRREHRVEIANAERQRRAFKRTTGTAEND